jgi:small GTP-binding protein
MTSEFKVVMLGEAGVGKTALVGSFCGSAFDPALQSTVGCAYATQILKLREQSIILNVWDTAGQERFNSLVPLYIRNAHGIAFVFDVTCKNPLPGLNQMYEMASDFIKPHMQLVLCANKIDLLDEDPDLRSMAVWAHAHGMEVLKVSAKTGQGVQSVFMWLAEKIASYGVRVRQLQSDALMEEICADGQGRARGSCC